MSDLLNQIVVPDLNDPLFVPFWAGMKARELRLQYCPASAKTYWPPRHRCAISGSTEFEWRPISTSGTIFSFVTVGKSMIKGFEAPYEICLIDLADAPGVRVVGVLDTAHKASIGAKVTGYFVEAGENQEITLLRWRVAA
jgi:uncharacterized OB-fold protein